MASEPPAHAAHVIHRKKESVFRNNWVVVLTPQVSASYLLFNRLRWLYMNAPEGRPIEILLVEDTPTDVRLTIEVFKRAKVANHLTVASDGLEALEFLHRQGQFAGARRPDLILLDLKLPIMDGHEVLAAIKADPDLRSIPVIVLTSSTAEVDALRAYNHHAACYITKPVEFEEFVKVIGSIESFWFSVVVLPRQTPSVQITTR